MAEVPTKTGPDFSEQKRDKAYERIREKFDFSKVLEYVGIPLAQNQVKKIFKNVFDPPSIAPDFRGTPNQQSTIAEVRIGLSAQRDRISDQLMLMMQCVLTAPSLEEAEKKFNDDISTQEGNQKNTFRSLIYNIFFYSLTQDIINERISGKTFDAEEERSFAILSQVFTEIGQELGEDWLTWEKIINSTKDIIKALPAGKKIVDRLGQLRASLDASIVQPYEIFMFRHRLQLEALLDRCVSPAQRNMLMRRFERCAYTPEGQDFLRRMVGTPANLTLDDITRMGPRVQKAYFGTRDISGLPPTMTLGEFRELGQKPLFRAARGAGEAVRKLPNGMKEGFTSPLSVMLIMLMLHDSEDKTKSMAQYAVFMLAGNMIANGTEEAMRFINYLSMRSGALSRLATKLTKITKAAPGPAKVGMLAITITTVVVAMMNPTVAEKLADWADSLDRTLPYGQLRSNLESVLNQLNIPLDVLDWTVQATGLSTVNPRADQFDFLHTQLEQNYDWVIGNGDTAKEVIDLWNYRVDQRIAAVEGNSVLKKLYEKDKISSPEEWKLLNLPDFVFRYQQMDNYWHGEKGDYQRKGLIAQLQSFPLVPGGSQMLLGKDEKLRYQEYALADRDVWMERDGIGISRGTTTGYFTTQSGYPTVQQIPYEHKSDALISRNATALQWLERGSTDTPERRLEVFFHDLDDYIETLMEQGSIRPETFTYTPPFRFFTLVNGKKTIIPEDAVSEFIDVVNRKKTKHLKTTRDLPGIPKWSYIQSEPNTGTDTVTIPMKSNDDVGFYRDPDGSEHFKTSVELPGIPKYSYLALPPDSWLSKVLELRKEWNNARALTQGVAKQVEVGRFLGVYDQKAWTGAMDEMQKGDPNRSLLMEKSLVQMIVIEEETRDITQPDNAQEASDLVRARKQEYELNSINAGWKKLLGFDILGLYEDAKKLNKDMDEHFMGMIDTRDALISDIARLMPIAYRYVDKEKMQLILKDISTDVEKTTDRKDYDNAPAQLLKVRLVEEVLDAICRLPHNANSGPFLESSSDGKELIKFLNWEKSLLGKKPPYIEGFVRLSVPSGIIYRVFYRDHTQEGFPLREADYMHSSSYFGRETTYTNHVFLADRPAHLAEYGMYGKQMQINMDTRQQMQKEAAILQQKKEQQKGDNESNFSEYYEKYDYRGTWTKISGSLPTYARIQGGSSMNAPPKSGWGWATPEHFHAISLATYIAPGKVVEMELKNIKDITGLDSQMQSVCRDVLTSPSFSDEPLRTILNLTERSVKNSGGKRARDYATEMREQLTPHFEKAADKKTFLSKLLDALLKQPGITGDNFDTIVRETLQ